MFPGNCAVFAARRDLFRHARIDVAEHPALFRICADGCTARTGGYPEELIDPARACGSATAARPHEETEQRVAPRGIRRAQAGKYHCTPPRLPRSSPRTCSPAAALLPLRCNRFAQSPTAAALVSMISCPSRWRSCRAKRWRCNRRATMVLAYRRTSGAQIR